MLLIIDVEATCWNNGDTRTKKDREIIEIGAVLLLDEQIKPKYKDDYAPSFTTFIQPVRYPKLTDFCTNLTSIKQSDVDGASFFSEALRSFLRQLSPYLGPKPLKDMVWASWGAYDRKQMLMDCELHGVKYPFGRHWNIKQAYSRSRGVKKGFGLSKALRQLDIPFTGTAHRGVDDAIMISKVVREALGNEYGNF